MDMAWYICAQKCHERILFAACVAHGDCCAAGRIGGVNWKRAWPDRDSCVEVVVNNPERSSGVCDGPGFAAVVRDKVGLKPNPQPAFRTARWTRIWRKPLAAKVGVPLIH